MSNQPNLFDDIKPRQKGNRDNIKALAIAIAEAIPIDLEHSTKRGKTALFVSAAEIDRAGGKPEEVAGVLARMKESNKAFRTHGALASRWGEFYHTPRPRYDAKKRDIYDVRLERLQALSSEAYNRVTERCEHPYNDGTYGPGELRFARKCDEALDAEETNGR